MNNVVGWFNYDGVVAQQHDKIGDVFKKLFERTKPKRILEIGTSYGGLTLILRDILDNCDLIESKIRTYDVVNRNQFNEFSSRKKNIEFLLKDVFNHQYDDIILVDEIKSYIQQNGVSIVLCDGGSKKNEFRILSRFLKPNDIIMAHDYAPNENYFIENIKDKIWNWHEIQDSDIDLVCDEHNLKSYMQEEFNNVVWVCKMKFDE